MIFTSISPLKYRWSAPLKFFFTFLLFFSLFAPLPYVFFLPGTPDDVGGSLITIKDAKTYPTHGKLFITSILVTNPDASVFGFETAFNWSRASSVVLPRDVVYPPTQSAEEAEQESVDDMATSQSAATAAALRHLGYKVTPAFYISKVRDYSDARGKLLEQDYVIAIDGKKIMSVDDIRNSYAQKKVGEKLRITVERFSESGTSSTSTFDVALISSQEPSSSGLRVGQPAIGVLIGTTGRFPLDVRFNLNEVGGPSAGLIFAVGIVEKLTEEDLLRGRSVAGTGTISTMGQVGAIGGIEEKMIGARRAGATIFLAPRENCPDINHIPRGLTVISVSTLDEAISVLRSPENAKFPHC